MKGVRDTLKWTEFIQLLKINAEYIDVDKVYYQNYTTTSFTIID